MAKVQVYHRLIYMIIRWRKRNQKERLLELNKVLIIIIIAARMRFL